MPERSIRIALGSDHAGLPLKEKIHAYLASRGYEVEDHGTTTAESVDYPDFAERVAARVAARQVTYGILFDGAGIAMAMAANKVPGVRAASCGDTLTARMAREHNNANVLAMGGRTVDERTARNILDTWLGTAFASRHQQRLDKIAAIERKYRT